MLTKISRDKQPAVIPPLLTPQTNAGGYIGEPVKVISASACVVCIVSEPEDNVIGGRPPLAVWIRSAALPQRGFQYLISAKRSHSTHLVMLWIWSWGGRQQAGCK